MCALNQCMCSENVGFMRKMLYIRGGILNQTFRNYENSTYWLRQDGKDHRENCP